MEKPRLYQISAAGQTVYVPATSPDAALTAASDLGYVVSGAKVEEIVAIRTSVSPTGFVFEIRYVAD